MLGTHAAFAYQPADEEIRRKIGATINKNPKKLSDKDVAQHEEKAKKDLI